MDPFSFFCIIGGQRCGTTWLARHLDSHSSVQLAKPMRPEPQYFIEEGTPDKAEYIKRYFDFKNGIPDQIGEKSTSYLEYPEVAYRIIQCFPEAKIIVLLRDPVERAISNYKFSVDNGLETRSLREVFIEGKNEPVLEDEYSVNPFDYFERGLYAKQLAPYLNVFAREKIGIWLYEEVVGQVVGFKNILNFLNTELANENDRLKRRINKSSPIMDEASSEIRTLLQERYAPFNRELEKLADLDLSAWDYS